MNGVAIRVRALVAAGFLVLGSASAAPSPSADDSLRRTLDAHLAAINARDLDALLRTVTAGPRLTLILPDGRRLTTREEYRQLHVDWFQETDWRMRFEVVETRAFADAGVALVKYRSQTRQPDGAYATRREAWLSLVFAKEAGEWRLVFDQNTVIPTPAPAPATSG